VKVLLVDSYNMIYRARHGFGEGPHAVVFNFFRQLKSQIDQHKPDIVYMVDEGKPVQSLAVDANYKGTRTHSDDDGFKRQKREILQISKTILGVRYAMHPERECDDVISHLALNMHKEDEIVVLSTDTDFIQLLDERENLKIYNPVKKEFVERIPNYAIYKSLKGDPTDNIPGIPGVGHIKATELASNTLARNFFLEKHMAHKIFSDAYTMVKFKSVPEDELVYIETKFDEQKLLEEFTNREFKSIIGNAWPKWVKAFGGINGEQKAS
jgi:5'-3' exonuclease